MSRVIVLLLLLTTPLLGQEIRTFTSNDGKTIHASVVNYNPEDGKVVIRLENNSKYTLAIDRFSPEDQAYLKQWRDEYDREFVDFEFMGVRVRSSRIIFLIDKSGSMHGKRWEKLLDNLEDVIMNLDTPSDINIITFSSFPTSFKQSIQPVSKALKHEAVAWLKRESPSGGTGTGRALETAFRDPEVETIVLLSDGYPNQEPQAIYGIVELLQGKREKPITIHTVAYQTDQGKNFLRELAKRNKGRFANR